MQALLERLKSVCAKGSISQKEWNELMVMAHKAKITNLALSQMAEDELRRVKAAKEAKAVPPPLPPVATPPPPPLPQQDQALSGFETTPPPDAPKEPAADNTLSGFDQEPKANDPPPENGKSGFETLPGGEPKAVASGQLVVPDGSEMLASFAVGDSIFTELTPLGEQGAMSLTSRAKFQGRWVVVKRLKPEHRGDAQREALLLREFDNASLLDHPNIVRLIAKGKDKEGSFYFMDYVDGRGLDKAIGQTGIADHKLAKRIMEQILDAMSYVHKKQIFHRDLKPANILLTYRGDNVKILDFGLAAADHFEDRMAKVGTPLFAAPEQLARGSQVDQRADIYSIGLIFSCILTGSPRPAPGQIQDAVLAELIDKASRPKPEERFSDCDQMLGVLRAHDTPASKTLPDWLEQRISEIAADAVVTPSERRVLDLEVENGNIDPDMVEALLDMELEKAKQRIEQEKAMENARLKADKERKLEQQRLAQAEKEREARFQQNMRQQQAASASQRQGQPPAEATRSGRWLFVLLFLAMLGFLGWRFRDLLPWPKAAEQEQAQEDPLPGANTRWVSTGSGLNLREAANQQGRLITTLPKGTRVEVVSPDGKGWALVRTLDGQEGYVSTRYLSGTEILP